MKKASKSTKKGPQQHPADERDAREPAQADVCDERIVPEEHASNALIMPVNVTLQKICAWCREDMAPGAEPVTYGICAKCFEKVRVRNNWHCHNPCTAGGDTWRGVAQWCIAVHAASGLAPRAAVCEHLVAEELRLDAARLAWSRSSQREPIVADEPAI